MQLFSCKQLNLKWTSLCSTQSL